MFASVVSMNVHLDQEELDVRMSSEPLPELKLAVHVLFALINNTV